MFKSMMLLCLSTALFAAEFTLVQGSVKAHTEVFGDSKIDVATSSVKSTLLSNEKGLKSLSGDIYFDYNTLKSENASRDENMHHLVEMQHYPKVLFTLEGLEVLEGNKVLLKGSLELNGIVRALETQAVLLTERDALSLEGTFSINMKNFGLTPPSMFFVTVREVVDIYYSLAYKKGA